MAQAAPIWKAFMTEALKIQEKKYGNTKRSYPEKTPLQTRKVNKLTGKLATEFTPASVTREEVFASFSIPTELDDSIREIEIDTRTGTRAREFTPYYAREKKFILTKISDVRPDLSNWELPAQEWLKKHPAFLTSLGLLYEESSSEQILPEIPDSPEQLKRRSELRRKTILMQKNAAQSKPKISILSPQKNQTVPQGRGEIQVQIASTSRIKAVEFYVNGELVSDAESYPWSGIWNIQEEKKYRIKAVAIDENGQFGETEIEVMGGASRQTFEPVIYWENIKANEAFPLFSETQILLKKVVGVELQSVELFLDNTSLGKKTSEPYLFPFFAQGEMGTKKLKAKATEKDGTMSEIELLIIIQSERILQGTIPEITAIESKTAGIQISLVIPSPSSVESLTLKIKKNEELIKTIPVAPNAKIKNIWLPKSGEGAVQMLLEFKLKGGLPIESASKTINL